MENNNFSFIEDSIIQTIDIKEDTDIYILGIFKNDATINIDYKILNGINLNINFTYLTLNDANIKTKIDIQHLNHHASSKVITNIFALDNSNVTNDLYTYVDSKINDSKVDQKIKGIILSENANIFASPNLIINTDNIIATHALNIGTLNEEELFYLNTKGFNTKQAKQLLLNSMINTCLVSLDDNQKEKYSSLINKHL